MTAKSSLWKGMYAGHPCRICDQYWVMCTQHCVISLVVNICSDFKHLHLVSRYHIFCRDSLSFCCFWSCAVRHGVVRWWMHSCQYRGCCTCIRWCSRPGWRHPAAEGNRRWKDRTGDNDSKSTFLWTGHQVIFTLSISLSDFFC